MQTYLERLGVAGAFKGVRSKEIRMNLPNDCSNKGLLVKSHKCSRSSGSRVSNLATFIGVKKTFKMEIGQEKSTMV